MPTQITINSISGVSPYDVYLCDNPLTTCIWIDTIISSQLPYVFDVPSIMESQTSFNIKVVDDNNCTVIESPATCPEYLGYDLVTECFGVSVDFFVKLPEVIVGGVPCNNGNPSYGGNCPRATVEYSINSGSTTTILVYSWKGGNCGYTLAGCICEPIRLETNFLELSSYSGQTFVTIDFLVTYPSTPPLTFTETIIADFSSCYPTPTPTPTKTVTPTPTGTNGAVTPTPTPTKTVTPTPTGTNGTVIPVTSTPTPTNTQTPTNTVTPTNTMTNTPTPTPTPTSTGSPVAECLNYELSTLYADGVEFLLNGCCNNAGTNSVTLYNETRYYCSTTLPTTTGPGTVTLSGACPTC
jgi:hypothetical protein